jgi:hypothetical protein
VKPLPLTGLSSPTFLSAKLAPAAGERHVVARDRAGERPARDRGGGRAVVDLVGRGEAAVDLELRDVRGGIRHRVEAVVAGVVAGEREPASGDRLVGADVLVGEVARRRERDVVGRDPPVSERPVIVAALVPS